MYMYIGDKMPAKSSVHRTGRKQFVEMKKIEFLHFMKKTKRLQIYEKSCVN